MSQAFDSTPPPPAPLPSNVIPITREQARSRRKREVRARTVSNRRTHAELVQLRLSNSGLNYWRPQTRADCSSFPRPCPFVSCSYHLYLDVNQSSGSIKLNFPDMEPHQMGQSCSLDVADAGGTTLEDVGAIMNVTRERIRQLEVRALDKLEVLWPRLREVLDG